MAAYEVFIPSEGQARRFYESLTGHELGAVRQLLYDDLEQHPLPDDPEPPHLIKISLPVGSARNGVLATDGKYYLYYHFPELLSFPGTRRDLGGSHGLRATGLR